LKLLYVINNKAFLGLNELRSYHNC